MTPLDPFRQRTYAPAQVQTLEQAEAFVRARGFVFFWPIAGLELPSLWVAVAGYRPVPNNHDDPGHITWSWKDQMLGQKRWYYAKVLRGKATLISLERMAHFYALSPNYGEPEQDYLVQFAGGELSAAAKALYEVLLAEGATHTQRLRKRAGLSPALFAKALTELQAGFKVLPVGIARAGRWKYAYVYDCVHRHFPELIEQARVISSQEARQTLLQDLFLSLGASQGPPLRKLLGWDHQDLLETLEALQERQVIKLQQGLWHLTQGWP